MNKCFSVIFATKDILNKQTKTLLPSQQLFTSLIIPGDTLYQHDMICCFLDCFRMNLSCIIWYKVYMLIKTDDITLYLHIYLLIEPHQNPGSTWQVSEVRIWLTLGSWLQHVMAEAHRDLHSRVCFCTFLRLTPSLPALPLPFLAIYFLSIWLFQHRFISRR